MIDTDKYEGHTEGPWILGSNTEKNSNGHRTSYGTDERPIIYSDVAIRTNYKGQEMSVKIGQVNRESAQLIADAPLLLAEVKRHRPPAVDGKYMAWSDSHPNHDRRTWIEQVMEGITDVGYWTWVNWQLQYEDDFMNENGEMFE